MNEQNEQRDFIEAMGDPRVWRALHMASRDVSIRRRFEMLRSRMTGVEALLLISEEFHLSEDRVRSIIYRKGTADH